MISKFIISNTILLIVLSNYVTYSKPIPSELVNRLKRQLELLNQYRTSENLLDSGNSGYLPYQSLSTNFIPQQQYENNFDFQNYPITKTTTLQTDHEMNNNQQLYFPSFSSSKLPSSNSVDSPIYYVKLPPAPYKFLPGFGYISQSPLNILPFQLPPMSNSNYQQLIEPMKNSLINLPLEFISNGKPTNILHFNNDGDLYNQGEHTESQQNLKGFNLPLSQYNLPYYNNFQFPNQAEMYMNSWPKPSSLKKNSLLKRLKNTLTFNGKPEHIRIHSGDMIDNFEAML